MFQIAIISKNYPIRLLKKIVYKWTCVVHMCAVQGTTVVELSFLLAT